LAKLYVGVARTPITPPVGVDLTGYAGRPTGCTGIHDDLYAKALVLSDGRTSAAIVSLDLLSLNDEQIARIREDATARTGIPSENMLIGASHTHSGPATQPLRACGTPDDAYVDALVAWIGDVLVEAAGDLRPASIGYCSAPTDIAVNRRYRGPDGAIRIAENVGGVADHEVGILRIADDVGYPLAIIFNHACHAVVMDGNNLLVSADWPGAAAQCVERETGATALFLQGCCGNINPREQGSFEAVERLGDTAARSVLSTLASIPAVSDARIVVAREVIHLPLQPPDVDAARAELAEAEQRFREKGSKASTVEIQLMEAYRDLADAVAAIADDYPKFVSFEIQRVSVGDAHIIALPGEVFVEIGLAIKALKPNVLVAGYANGNIGYVPTRSAFDEGGYEVNVAWKLYGKQMITPDAEELIIASARRLLNE